MSESVPIFMRMGTQRKRVSARVGKRVLPYSNIRSFQLGDVLSISITRKKHCILLFGITTEGNRIENCNSKRHIIYEVLNLELEKKCL